MKTIWLIGCGNIGFRHLQAMLAGSEPREILVIEPATALHDRIRTEAALDRPTAHRVTIADTIPDGPRPDLAVVATAAPPRAGIVKTLGSGELKAAILEKVLAQTDAELASMRGDLARAGAATHVNCPRRYFPGYQQLKARLQGPMSLKVEGAQFGLGSNAVHFLDLLEYLNGSALVSVDASGLDAGGKPSKRAGFQEIYGVLNATAQNGATLSISCADEDALRLSIALTDSEGQIWRIEEGASQITGRDGTQPFETRFVSQTPEIYADAIAGHSGLTSLDDSLRQHSLYLAALRKHFGLGDDQPVPVS